jgi:hypothetical protein
MLTVCESTDPPVKSLIEDYYVPWYCDVDSSWDYFAYFIGLAGKLPLIAIIDPANPDIYINRSSSTQPAADFYNRLQIATGGDIDDDGALTVADAVVSLQVLTDGNLSAPLHLQADADGDGRLGMAETIHILKELAR